MELRTTSLNRDNFWNLMFWLIPAIAVLAIEPLMLLIPIGGLLLLVYLLVAPYLLSRYMERALYSKASRQHLFEAPKYPGFVLWCSIPFTILGVLYIHAKYPSLDDNLAVYGIIFWTVPMMYCILKNLPFIILFDKKTWTEGAKFDVTPGNYDWFHNTQGARSSGIISHNSMHPSRIHSRSSESIMSGSNMRTSNVNSWYSGNIHHRK